MGIARWMVVPLVVAAGVAGGCSLPVREHCTVCVLQQYEQTQAAAAAVAPAAVHGRTWLSLGLDISMGEALAAVSAGEALADMSVGQGLADAGTGGDALDPRRFRIPPDSDVTPEDIARMQRELGYIPRPYRRGPAYPHDPWRNLVHEFAERPDLWLDNVTYTFSRGTTWAMLAAAGGIGIISHNAWDEDVRRHFRRHDNPLGSFWNSAGDIGGHPLTHGVASSILLVGAYHFDDVETYELSKTLLSAISTNGALTLGLKAAVRSERPNGRRWGWPSGHASSSFAVASVLHHHFGHEVGIPAYAAASYVSFQRIASRDHDLGDVLSGAIIGLTIGHTIAHRREMRFMGMTVIPYVSERGAAGVALYREF